MWQADGTGYGLTCEDTAGDARMITIDEQFFYLSVFLGLTFIIFAWVLGSIRTDIKKIKETLE